MANRLFTSVAAPAARGDAYWVYILQSPDDALYVGQTSNVPERLRKHGLGMGSKFTHDHLGARLVFVDGPFDRQGAICREAQLKRWSRAKKEALIAGDAIALHKLARSHR